MQSEPDDARPGGGVGHVSERTMCVEIRNEETGEARPAQLTATGILFDEVGIFGDEWFVANPVDRNLGDQI